MVGGVCSGLAGYFAVRPIWLRSTFLLWTLASTTGAIVYLALWAMLPEQSTGGHSWDESIGRNIADMRAQAVRWHRELEDILGAKGLLDGSEMRRAVILGSAVAGLGLLLLIDSLHLLGPFRLRQLEPLALVLLGIIFMKRAL
jgi:phage shock protein PspC (stress-responsive transcriptional regulator)